MKKISIAFAASMALMAFGGCKKKGGSDTTAMAEDICKCTDQKCVDEVQKKYTKTGDEAKSSGEVKPPTDEEMAALKKMAGCMQKIATGGDKKEGGGDMKEGGDKKEGGGDKKEGGGDKKEGGGDKKEGGGGAANTGVKECDDVVAAYEKLFNCDKFKGMPAEAQDAQKKGLDTMKSAWHFDNDAAKDAAKPGCKAALDGLHQSAKAMGCEI